MFRGRESALLPGIVPRRNRWVGAKPAEEARIPPAPLMRGGIPRGDSGRHRWLGSAAAPAFLGGV